MDPMLDRESRRLTLAALLSGQAGRHAGGRIAATDDGAAVVALARRLAEAGQHVERTLGLRFEPPYPGVTAGPEAVGGGLRLVLACAASDAMGTLGIVFTTLIPGRAPQVSVAPAVTPVPEDWRPPAESV